MRIPDPYVYGVVVAIVSAIATVVASRVAFHASKKSAASALDGIARQIEFQTRGKVAEFRQAWINELRNQMSKLQSISTTPGLNHEKESDFYRAGTMIDLLRIEMIRITPSCKTACTLFSVRRQSKRSMPVMLLTSEFAKTSSEQSGYAQKQI